jgi:hypothetical protein
VFTLEGYVRDARHRLLGEVRSRRMQDNSEPGNRQPEQRLTGGEMSAIRAAVSTSSSASLPGGSVTATPDVRASRGADDTGTAHAE